ncbi:endonuclease/exonuclease/phosphatase family protein [Candidatus Nomurabacteria bacterium]|jgi:endonuclease/exonuclease/phosphatase family metal-dependent hydrolase|nr:MAG: endonuclease/exonuclease/phosphatase family protein [Candidatus Nomurabacteria bacterium]
MQIKILTWNLGCFSWMKLAAKLHYAYRGNSFKHEYFQPKINAKLVDEELRKVLPDIVCLQEFYEEIDMLSIPMLESYPYKAFVTTWYHKHSILIASKLPFTVGKQSFASTQISFELLDLYPVHLNSFYAKKRLEQVEELCALIKHTSTPQIITGDMNFWKIGNFFVFKNDKRAYRLLEATMTCITKGVSHTPFGMEFDGIFTSNEFKTIKVTQELARGDFMDHYPVWCEVLL